MIDMPRSVDCWSPTAARSPAASSDLPPTSASRPSRSTPTPDAGVPYVREADRAVRAAGRHARRHLPATPSTSSRRRRRPGADAVHPGYGFLSENAGFARAVIDAGLTWVGPPPEAIDAMGSKIERQEADAAEAGVPVLPGRSTPADGHRGAVLPRAGQGVGRRRRPRHARRARRRRPGRGGRAARREARSRRSATAPCSSSRTCERARHVEVQVVGRQARHACSTWASASARSSGATRRWSRRRRRRRSTPALREQPVRSAAVAAAEAIGYVGAGTVEFLLDEDARQFFFLEMNTRLQVEHPVTECVTASTWSSCSSASPRATAARRDAAATARATRSRSGSTPRTRPRLAAAERHAARASRCPASTPSSRARGRTGSGWTPASSPAARSSTHYDPMLAKVIAYGADPDRRRRGRLATALAGARIHGPVTNRDLLVSVLRHGPSSPATPTPASSTEHDDRPVRRRRATRGRARLSALAAALAPAAAQPGGGDRARPACRAAWRNVAVAAPAHGLRARLRSPIGSRTASPGTVCCADGYAGDVEPGRAPRPPLVVAGRPRRAAPRSRSRRYDGGDVHVDSVLGSVTAHAARPRLPDPAEQVAPGLPARAHARLR